MSRGASRRERSARVQADKSGVINKGAVQRKTRIRDKLSSYWSHHSVSSRDALHRLLMSPGQTFVTSMVLAIALSLPVILLLVLGNVKVVTQSWDGSPKISVYANPRAKPQAIDALVQTLTDMEGVESVAFVSADQALAEFKQFSQLGAVLNALDENPLPATIVVSPSQQAATAEGMSSLALKISELAVVDEVDLDIAWVRRLQALMTLAQKVVIALAILLAIGAVLALGNTIRLSIENRRDEVIVAKLVGATNAFVRRPFIYSGAWYGLFGGFLAGLIVLAGFYFLHGTVETLANLYGSKFRLEGLDGVAYLKLLALSMFLGVLSSLIAVGRHLRHIEPK